MITQTQANVCWLRPVAAMYNYDSRRSSVASYSSMPLVRMHQGGVRDGCLRGLGPLIGDVTLCWLASR